MEIFMEVYTKMFIKHDGDVVSTKYSADFLILDVYTDF